MSTAQKILLPGVTVLALIGIGLGVAALATQPSTSGISAQLKTLRADLASADGHIRTLESATAQAATSGNVSKLQDQVRTLKLCLPQLQQEVGNLNIQQSTQGGYLTNAYIQNSTIISQDCNKVLYGGGSGH